MIPRLEIDLIIVGMMVTTFAFALTMLLQRRYPSVETIEGIAAIFNTKGGIIMFLWIAWWMTLLITIAFGMWVIIRGVDPQHGVMALGHFVDLVGELTQAPIFGFDHRAFTVSDDFA